MSLQTWIDEFYPVKASQAANDPLVAAEASLLKWRGLTNENLEAHSLRQKRNRIKEVVATHPFFIDDESCSLCQYSHKMVHGTDTGDCLKNCPLGHLIYSQTFEDEKADLDEQCTCVEEFREYLSSGNPRPMIRALEETVEMLKENKQTIEFPTELKES